ncbi:MAG: metal ABC transporter permease [Gemmatimonadetes bacterium]|nr:metal ABC transporter permease [Gemmatimonadota bacterium]
MSTPADLLGWWNDAGLPAVHHALRAILPFEWARWDFMLNALIEAVLLAPLCAAMGVKVVNFRMAFFSDAISHSAFAGVAIGFLLHELFTGFSPQVALVAFGVLVGLGISAVRRRTELSTDTVIGVFFSTVVALGLAIITTSEARTEEFRTYLYGDILTLTPANIGVTAILAGVVLLYLLINFNALLLVGLNDELAHSRGVAVRTHDYLFSLMLALVVTVSIRTAGILLVTAMLVVPAAAARNVARSAGGMFWWAMLLGLVSGVAGTVASFSVYLENVSTGAMIVLAAAVLFTLSFFARRA